MRTRDILIRFWLTEDEAEKLRTYANLCGLTQSALARMLIRGEQPQPNPPPAFWELLNELYGIHNSFRIIGESSVDVDISERARGQQKEIVDLILRLQAAVTQPQKAV